MGWHCANRSVRWGLCGENNSETSCDNIILLGFWRSLGACPNYWSCSGFLVDVPIFANTHRTSGSKRLPPTGVLGCSFVSLSQHVKSSTDRRNLKNCSGPRLFQAFFRFRHIATADATEIATRSRRAYWLSTQLSRLIICSRSGKLKVNVLQLVPHGPGGVEYFESNIMVLSPSLQKH